MQYHNMLNGRDCLRTSLACILNRTPESVPDFSEETDPIKNAAAYRGWLADEGFGLVDFPWHGSLHELRTFMHLAAPQTPWLLGAKIAQRTRHTFVFRGGSLLHDCDSTGAATRGLQEGLGELQVLILTPGSMAPDKAINPKHASEQLMPINTVRRSFQLAASGVSHGR